MTEEKIETIPATEESLMIENDVHPFDKDLPKTVNFFEQMHPVLVDGIKCQCLARIRRLYGSRRSSHRGPKVPFLVLGTCSTWFGNPYRGLDVLPPK